MRHPTHDNCPTCTARERARIRRVQSRAMKALASVTASAGDYVHMADLHDYLSAIGTVSDIINSLPEPVRRLVHDIETNCDPAGAVRDNVLLRDQIAALETRLAQAEQRETWWSNEATQWAADRDEQVLKLAQAERERDDWQERHKQQRKAIVTSQDQANERGRQVEQMAEHVAKMRVELDEATAKLYGGCESCTDAKPILCAACVDHESDNATARERERCLAWVQADVVEREACRVCVAAEAKVLGHTECWRLVKLAREIRMLGTKEET